MAKKKGAGSELTEKQKTLKVEGLPDIDLIAIASTDKAQDKKGATKETR